MVRVTAATSFHGNEGMWRAGETKSVSAHRAHELIEQGLVIESSDQSSPKSSLEQAADAIGATVVTGEALAASLQAAADALNAEPVTTETVKGKKKPKPGEGRETKSDSPTDTE
ncbi:hypothetical protein [Hymenobacter fodinae]|uniref:Uncharacterized protein n=1 Tax=Hymenobacter fodinae TaxID=2510796 RepID=A0A4Z0P2H8_9BACT|nr:hypothetical protein [Hymenobacter fodinae]TGE05563.1 hypothetical protein EU556_19885 [Hymenobacter fodinae]